MRKSSSSSSNKRFEYNAGKRLAKDWQNRLQSVGLAVREDRSSVGIVQVDPDPWGIVVDSLVNVPANVNGVDNLFSKCKELRDFSLSVFSLVNLLSRKLGFHYVWRKHVLVSCREKKRGFFREQIECIPTFPHPSI